MEINGMIRDKKLRYDISKYQLQKYQRYALVIARFRVQYGQYFPSFSYFADLFAKIKPKYKK